MMDALRDEEWWRNAEVVEGGVKETRFVSKDFVLNDYVESCRTQGRSQYLLAREQVSKLLIDCLGFRPSRKRVVGGERLQFYALPALQEARAKFIAKFELRNEAFEDESELEAESDGRHRAG